MAHAIVPLVIIGLVVYFTFQAVRRASSGQAGVRNASATFARFASTGESLAELLTELDPDMPVAERREMLAEFGVPETVQQARTNAENAAQVAAARAAALARTQPDVEASGREATPAATQTKKSKKHTKAHRDSSTRPPQYEYGALEPFAPFAALDPYSPMAPLKKRRPLAILAPLEPMGESAAYAARS